jgi:2-methylaconitate cis-trans-isomerase PrpF
MRSIQHGESLGSVTGEIIRGGTSKGLFLTESNVPGDDATRDELALELFGSPDPLQLNGIGGAKSHTSKLMIVTPADTHDLDVEYTFAQVGIDDAEIDWTKNCGNLTSAIGLFAVREGMVPAREPETHVTLHNTNTDTVVEQQVPIENGEPAVYGDFSIDGVPGTGARITSEFRDPGGVVTGAVLPTGNAVDTLEIDGSPLDVSLVDATNLLLFVRASDIGLDGTELPGEIAQMPDLLERLEAARARVREMLGMDDAKRSNPSIGIVSEPQSYECSVDERVDEDDISITSRFISLQPHHAIGMTGAMCLGAATRVPGTIPHEVARPGRDDEIVIGHPKGTVSVGVDVDETGGETRIESITNYRTACPVMSGDVYYRKIGALSDL